MNGWLYLALGGLAGTFARYGLAGAVYRTTGTLFPWGTFAVNMLGCLAIGVFSALAEAKSWLTPEGRLLCMTGFCGAFTTFSTLILETHQLLKGGEWHRAAANLLLSVFIGYLLFRVGLWLGESF